MTAASRTKQLSYKPLSYVLLLSVVGLLLLFILSGAAPLLYVFFLAAIIPVTAYLYLRAKWFALFTPVFLGAVLLINYNVIFVLCIPLLIAGTVACIAAAKSSKLFFGVALIITAVLTGLAFPVWLVTTISGKNAGETVAEYIMMREDDTAIVNLAKNYVFESTVADALAFGTAGNSEDVRRDAALAVNGMSTDNVLSLYSDHIKDIVNFELLFFVFSTGTLIAMTAFLLLTLLLLSYQYLLKDSVTPPYMSKSIYKMTPPRHIIMPRRYALYVITPYIVLFLLRSYIPFFKMIFDATYFGVILVPFGFAGIGLTYYLLGRLKLNAGYSSLIVSAVLILTFLGMPVVFLLFSCLGMVDYFLNLRFIIEHYHKQPNKKENNK